jgi:hypothetical protein
MKNFLLTVVLCALCYRRITLLVLETHILYFTYPVILMLYIGNVGL